MTGIVLSVVGKSSRKQILLKFFLAGTLSVLERVDFGLIYFDGLEEYIGWLQLSVFVWQTIWYNKLNIFLVRF